MISTTSHTAHLERPERSRNAKAQARHRAKRKAYIEQLEQTVTKLQTALDFTPEEVAALPPPLLRIRELEQDNARLEKENEELRRMLSDGSMDLSRRNSPSAFPEARICDRDFKRRKMGGEGLYMNAHDVSQQSGDTISRPPPLMIPQTVSHHYPQIPSSGSHHSVNGSASMYSLHAPAYQMPDTPSGSSATSSPPFSPTQMQEPLHSSINHRSSVSQNSVMQNYTQRAHQYAGVKVEDDHYVTLRHQQSHNDGHYPLHVPYNNATNGGMDWHAYSAERVHAHR